MSLSQDIIDKITAVPLRGGRRIIAIAGGPASGKSTLSAKLASRIPNGCVVPMDGFHRDNVDLDRHGLLARKGAPETFDVAAFIQLVQSLRSQSNVAFPTFDRLNDRVVIDGGHVKASDQTILVEGNYLLLNRPPWADLAPIWDLSIQLDVPLDMLRNRLVKRWLDHGHTHPEALARAEGNDLANARLLATSSFVADLVIASS